MIISFKNINGGGGGGYVLPTATPTRLGGVKIGDGINVDSAGTISVSGGSGGDSTKLISVSELPTGATEGDVVSLFKEYESESYCYIEANGEVKTSTFNFDGGSEGGTINIHTGNILPSENLLILTVEYWGYNNIYLTSAGTYVLDGGITGDVPIDIQPSGWTRDEDTNYFSVMPTAYGLDLTFKNERTVEVHYSQPIETKIVSNMYVWDTLSPTCKINRVSENGRMLETLIISWFGDLPINEPLIKMHSNDWNEDFYMAFNGTSFPMYRDSGLTSYWATFAEIGVTTGGLGWAHISTASEGLIVYTLTELNVSFEMLGDWFEAGNGHWKPIDYESIVNNAIQSITKTKNAQVNVPSVGGFTTTILDSQSMFLTFYAPSNGGTKGQILQSNGDGQAPVWINSPKTEIYQSLPFGANEGDVILTNTEYYPYTASTFIAMNSTSESDKNNFSNDNELGWYDWGNNNYIYFGNASAYTNTKDTFLYKIAIRTNENSDWKTSELAYINVVKANDTYEILMDNFNYYDTGGTPVPYTFNFTLSSTGTTSGNTPYLPLWKWWDGGSGYKFHFEIDQDNNLKMWMKNSYADNEQQDPDYVQGQNYGDVPVKCMDHTELFYDYINLDQDDTYMHIYKGGVWYELGHLTRQGV